MFYEVLLFSQHRITAITGRVLFRDEIYGKTQSSEGNGCGTVFVEGLIDDIVIGNSLLLTNATSSPFLYLVLGVFFLKKNSLNATFQAELIRSASLK